MNKYPCVPYCLALILGIVIGYHAHIAPVTWVVIMMAFLIVVVSVRRQSSFFLFFSLCDVLVLGAFLASRSIAHSTLDEYSYHSYHCVVTDEHAPTDKCYAYTCRIVDDAQPSHPLIRCYVPLDTSDGLVLGGTYVLSGKYRPYENHGEGFDFVKWARSHGYVAQLYATDDNISSSEPLFRRLSLIDRCSVRLRIYARNLLNDRFFARNTTDDEVHEKASDILFAMMLGDKSRLGKDVKDGFSTVGLSHLLALSGMHLGILYGFLSIFLFGVSIRWRPFLTILVLVPVWLYVLLVGMPSSIVRAALMITIYAIITVDGRRKGGINLLSFVAMVMLMASPLRLYDVGFQLSFCSLAGIFIIQPFLEQLISSRWLFHHQLFKRIWQLATVSVAAQAMTAPLVLYYFGSFSFVFLISNIVAIPIVTVMLYCAFLSVASLAVPFASAVTTFMSTMALWLSSVLAEFVEWLSAVPYAHVDNVSIPAWQVGLMYMALVAVLLLTKKYYTKKH